MAKAEGAGIQRKDGIEQTWLRRCHPPAAWDQWFATT
jgi:hypothetical protein